MARAAKKKPQTRKTRASKKKEKQKLQPLRWLFRWGFRGVILISLLMVMAVITYSFINPRTTPYMLSEAQRTGSIDQQWVDFSEVSPIVARSIVAAEDANYCLHWGFDMAAIRDALDGGSKRGASTISQQMVKNVYLWQGRSWLRKALEAIITPIVELTWSKKRILEVYMNIAEFGDGVFGIEAAARTYFRVGPDALSAAQAARLAAVLPSPKTRSASHPSAYVRKRARAIADGAATIAADGRNKCFES